MGKHPKHRRERNHGEGVTNSLQVKRYRPQLNQMGIVHTPEATT